MTETQRLPEPQLDNQIIPRMRKVAAAGFLASGVGMMTSSMVTRENVDSARDQQDQAIEIIENIELTDPGAPVLIESATEKLKDGQKDEHNANFAEAGVDILTFGSLAAGSVANSVVQRSKDTRPKKRK